MKAPAASNALLVIVFAALCTAGGHPETLFIGVLAISLFLLMEVRSAGFGSAALVPSAVGALLGFLLLAIQVIPFLHILSDSYAEILRPSMPHPFRIWGALSQLLPGILGTPLRGELDLTAVPLAENFHLRVGGFVGAVTILTLGVTLRQLPRPLRRGLLIGVVALVLSWFPPGVWAVARRIPVLQVLTFEYLAAVFVFFAALAAGPAIAFLAKRPRRKVGATLLVLGTLTMIGGLLPMSPPARPLLQAVARSGVEHLRARGHFRHPTEVYEQRLNHYLDAAALTAARRIALPGACWAAAGLVLLAPLRRRAIALSCVVLAELFSFGFGLNPAVRMENVAPQPPVIAAVKRLDPAGQFLIATHFEVFPANLGTLYGVRDAISYDALTTRRRAAQLIPAGYDPLLHTFHPILAPEQVAALAPLGVRYVLSREGVYGLRRVAGPPQPAVGVYEVESAIPLAKPRNAPPAGLIAGLIISTFALFASLVWLRMYTLPEITSARPARGE